MTTDDRTIAYKPGDLVGSDYCLLERLGEGGMGMVFRAKHMIMESIYALKILRPEQITSATWMRFQAEGKTLSKLNHPNIVQIYNMGIDRERVPFYVMELLSGRSLSDEIASQGPRSFKRTAEIFIPVCSGLAFSHNHGIIHRDIKPSNVMLVGDKQNISAVKLVDFGIAKAQHLSGYEGQSLTTTGEIFGTPYYLSPECIAGSPADARSDIYSLGCAIFEALTGAPPFRGQSTMHTLMMHQNTPPPTLKSINPGGNYPYELEVFIATLLAKDPNDRFQNMASIGTRLQQLSESDVAKNEAIKPIGIETNRQQSDQEQQFTTTTVATPRASGWQKKLALAGLLVAISAIGIVLAVPVFAPKQKQKLQIERVASALSNSLYHDAKESFMGISKFSLGIKGNGRAARYYYHFSPQISIGQINHYGPTTKEIQAQGDFSVPADEKMSFRLDANMGDVNLLSGLNVDEFSELRCSPQSLEKLTAIISKWTKLTGLYMEDFFCDSEKDLGYIDQLKQLQSLTLSHCAFPSHGFARLKILSQLETLHLEKVKDSSGKSNSIDEMFEGIGKQRKLQTLWLEQVMLSHKLVKEISANKKISTLVLASGQESNVLTDEDILTLSAMPSLKKLKLGNAHLTPKAIEYFKNGFNQLTWLELPTQNWSSQNKKEIAALFSRRYLLFSIPSKAKDIRDQF